MLSPQVIAMPSDPPSAPAPADARCCCGSLLARIVPGGLELKCRRCRRLMLVPVAEGIPGPPRPADESEAR
jgi:hypothetical protein